METSPYLEGKWRNFFRFLDVDRDGVVSFRDYEILAKRFAELAGMPDLDAEEVRKSCLRWWWVMEKTIGKKTENMTENSFVESITTMMTSPHVNARFSMASTWGAMFDVLDSDRDGQVTSEQLQLFYRCHGITDEFYVESVFRNLDTNRDGLVSRQEFIQALQEFWFGGNPNEDFSFMFSRKTLYPPSKRSKRCPWLRKYFCCCH